VTGTSPLRRSRAASHPLRMWRLPLVAVASLFLAFCGVRMVATAQDVPPPIILNLSEGIGVSGGQQAVGPATTTVTEPIGVGDPTGVFSPATPKPTEGIVVSDTVTVLGPAVVTLTEGIAVGDASANQTGRRVTVTEGISIGDAVTIRLPDADVSVQLSATPDPANPGAPLTYLVTLGNNGPGAATAARFTFTAPVGTTFVSIDGGFACAPVASALDCRSTQGSAFSVASGATAAFHLVFNVASNATGPLVATVTATSDASDPTLANNTATLSTRVNAAPAVTPAAAQTVTEGTSASVALGSFTDDPGDGPWTVTIDWGDGTPPTTRTVQSAGALAPESHTFVEGPASLTVRVRVTDRANLSGEATFTVTVANAPPASVALTLAQATIDEAGTATLSGSFTDPGTQDAHTVVIDWKDGSAPTTISLPAGTLTFSATHEYADDAPTATPADPYAIGATVTDDDGASAQGMMTLTVRNVPPVLGAITAPAAPQPAGAGVNASALFTDVGTLDTHAGTWSWGDGSTSAAMIVEANGAGTASGSHTYSAAGVYTVTLTLTDDDTGTATATFLMRVNGAPAVTPAAAQNVSEGTSASVALGAFTDDPGDAPWTVTIDWGDGTPTTTRTAQSAGTLAPETHTYVEGPASMTVRVRVTDQWGLSGEATFTVTVANAPPGSLVLSLAQPVIDEAGTATLSGSFSDPGTQDAHTVIIEWKDSSAPTTISLPAGTLAFNATHTYADDAPTATPVDPYAITVVVTDDDGASAQGTTTLTVRNVPPVLGAITAPSAPQATGTSVSASASFTDVGTSDTHAGTWSWGDGTTSTATIVEANGAGTASGTHTYSAAGVYTITLTLTDDDTGSASATFRYVVVYDTTSGFVTGGGWITSPAGAYVADPSLTGRASFGFVSRYQRGQTVPSGNTQFQFQAADLSFKSTSYDWLVIAGARAQYKGLGTINGSGDYAFMLTAVDGQTNGGGGTDRIRIKIWDRATGNVVYDNQLGVDENAQPSTVLGGGSIVIHQ
jgi:uncharacterized repeat protein (TIGR01451 family)